MGALWHILISLIENVQSKRFALRTERNTTPLMRPRMENNGTSNELVSAAYLENRQWEDKRAPLSNPGAASTVETP